MDFFSEEDVDVFLLYRGILDYYVCFWKDFDGKELEFFWGLLYNMFWD